MENGRNRDFTQPPMPSGLSPELEEIVLWMRETNSLIAGLVKAQTGQLEVIANLQKQIAELQARS